MKFKELELSDKSLFDDFLRLNEHSLSTYHFSNLFIWRRLFRIFYTLLDGCLCVFFRDKNSCFMYLPPLGKNPDPSIINACLLIMDEFNRNKQISRIENVEEKCLSRYREYGYAYSVKPGDYLYNREDVSFLKGNKYKSKRADYNYFVKHFDFKFRPYDEKDKSACLDLYQRWAGQRRNKFSDPLYRGMLEDNFSCQTEAADNFNQLGLSGYVIEIQDGIAGYSFGFPLNSHTFCILFEVCDLAYRGISQFIFSEFSRQLSGYQYINVMDDSGLQNLRQAKLSYHPIGSVANYIINRPIHSLNHRDSSYANQGTTVPRTAKEVSLIREYG